ncbi:MAG: type II toxin-antitoxin system prevent-host-death family antitoxin [Propionibacteriaceae bacterium]|nr:type II toxin-antitoxin system prevent-host-death family antitoxin [Propionibacteriaceae bacterium]
MSTVSVRDLRNHGGEPLARVQRGESLTVTSDGHPVARLTPLPSAAPPPRELSEVGKACEQVLRHCCDRRATGHTRKKLDTIQGAGHPLWGNTPAFTRE